MVYRSDPTRENAAAVCEAAKQEVLAIAEQIADASEGDRFWLIGDLEAAVWRWRRAR